MTARLQPAFWGGLFIGVLTALPLIKLGNLCCCMWVVMGGVLAVWVAQSNRPHPLQAADGALLGLLAGLIGAVIAFPISLVFESWEREMLLRFIQNLETELPPELAPFFENQGASWIGRIFNLFVSLIAYAVFGMLGGLLGVAIFKKNAPPPPPPGTVEVLPPE